MAGYQSSVSPLGAGEAPSQQSRINNLGGVLPRRPAPQYVQQLTGPQQVVGNVASRSSSQSSSSQMMNVVGSGAPVAQSHIFGKTSGWYHGAKFDIGDMWKAALSRENDTLKRCLKAGLNVDHSRWVKVDKIVGTGARSVADAIACRNDIKGMRLLIEHGVDLSGTAIATFASTTFQRQNSLFTEDERKVVTKDPWKTPLHFACKYGYVDMVRIILYEGHVDPNTRDSQGQTGLHMTAIGKNELEIAKILLERGAAIEAKDNLAATPLAAAALFGKPELAGLLVNHGAIIDATDSHGETAFYNASLRKHYDVLAVLATRGANLDLRNVDGYSAFFKAASRLNIESMDLLTELGADTDTRDNNGCTPFARATMAKNIPLTRHLLGLGVDIDAEDGDGWTPLFSAMIHNDEKLINLLLPYGSTMGKTDNHGNTALNQASILGATLVVRHILAFSPPNSINHSRMNLFGETSLALASKHSNSPIVKILLKHGASPHHVDPNGHRALDRAMYWGSYACVRLFLAAGASIDTKALFALQQGKYDNIDGMGSHDMILTRLRSQYPGLAVPSAMNLSPLRDIFARSFTHNKLLARMLEKQGKPALDLNALKDDKKEDEAASPDPFEACIPELPPAQIINNNTTNINASGSTALNAGIIGTNLALGITNTVLGAL